jgi:hypothetical protein
MTKVQELERAIKSLPPKDFRQFRNWFVSYDEKNWDAQIVKDQKDENSAIAKLARRALISHRQGKSSPL